MITENSTHKTQARAFSFFAFSGNLGIFLGNLAGTPSEIIDVIFNLTLFQVVLYRILLRNTPSTSYLEESSSSKSSHMPYQLS